MNITPQASLLTLNTMAIDSVADYLVEIESLKEFPSVLDFSKEKNLPLKILGGGSNVIMADTVSGIVLRYVGRDFEIIEETDRSIQVRVEAGLNWHQFVMMSLEKGWNGLENLSYIPGSVGASPVQNIGAYGVEVKDLIDTVEGIYLDTGEPFTFTNDQCEFSYRESIFKQSLNGKTLITHVTFKLSKLNDVNVTYAPLNKMAEEQGMPTPKQLSNWVVEVRQSKLPDPDELPNAGSFFKNPVVSQAQFEELEARYENMPSYANEAGVKLPAGWLIDQLGLKGQSFGSVSVHKQQALVLVNQGGTGKDVIDVAEEIKKRVKAEYSVQLEQEPRMFD